MSVWPWPKCLAFGPFFFHETHPCVPPSIGRAAGQVEFSSETPPGKSLACGTPPAGLLLQASLVCPWQPGLSCSAVYLLFSLLQITTPPLQLYQLVLESLSSFAALLITLPRHCLPFPVLRDTHVPAFGGNQRPFLPVHLVSSISSTQSPRQSFPVFPRRTLPGLSLACPVQLALPGQTFRLSRPLYLHPLLRVGLAFAASTPLLRSHLPPAFPTP